MPSPTKWGGASWARQFWCPDRTVGCVDATGTTVHGLLRAGSSPTTLTDSAGKVLTAALNTVGVGQGGRVPQAAIDRAQVRGVGRRRVLSVGDPIAVLIEHRHVAVVVVVRKLVVEI